MFIYILNLLYDGLKKKNNTNEHLEFEIINDTRYISQLAGIRKSIDFKSITDKIIDIFEVLNKYNLTNHDSIGIVNKLIKNDNNLWIVESFYYGDGDIKGQSEEILSLIVNRAFEKSNLKKVHENSYYDKLQLLEARLQVN